MDIDIETTLKDINDEYFKIENNARLIKDIKMYKVACKIHCVNIHAYNNMNNCTDNDYVTYLEKNPIMTNTLPYYNINALPSEIVEMLKTMIVCEKKNKELMHNDNIITDTYNKFVIIHSYDISHNILEAILEHKYDFIRMSMSDKYCNIFCVDKSNNLIKVLYGDLWMAEEIHENVKNIQDCLWCCDIIIGDDIQNYIVFSLDDFYNAMNNDCDKDCN